MTKEASEGRACNGCHATEARCAWTGTCCGLCSHFRHLDSAGNDKPKPLPALADRPVCGNCGRHVGIRGRVDCPGLCLVTSRDYDRARARTRARTRRHTAAV